MMISNFEFFFFIFQQKSNVSQFHFLFDLYQIWISSCKNDILATLDEQSLKILFYAAKYFWIILLIKNAHTKRNSNVKELYRYSYLQSMSSFFISFIQEIATFYYPWNLKPTNDLNYIEEIYQSFFVVLCIFCNVVFIHDSDIDKWCNLWGHKL